MKEQTRNTEVQINEEEIGKLPEKEFRLMIVKMIKNLENKMEKMQDSVNKDLEELKGEGNGTPLQYSCLENPMDGGAWWAAIHGVAKSPTRLSDFLSLFTFMHWRRKWQPTPVFLPGESQGRGNLVGCSLWGRTELDTTEAT